MRYLAIILLVAVILAAGAGLYVEFLYHEDTGNDASIRISVIVPHGATLKDVQADLVDKGILRRPNLFRWAAYLTRGETQIKSGRYLFRQGESVAAILRKLVAGEVNYSKIIIPEGLMASEVAGILHETADVDSAAFMRVAADSALLAELAVEAPTLEGYLFPDTYLFDWPIDPEDAIRRMVFRFRRVYAEAAAAIPDSIYMSVNEIVALASIVQAEAGDDSEMPLISAVFHNRLRAGWKLEADPTVAYALGGVRRRLWYRDLEVDSPYNTYRNKGLPPGAICNPGRSAIEAAIRPAPACLHFYFVADGTGRHKFSNNYFDHLRAKQMFRYKPVASGMKEISYLEATGMETTGVKGDNPKPCAPDTSARPDSSRASRNAGKAAGSPADSARAGNGSGGGSNGKESGAGI